MPVRLLLLLMFLLAALASACNDDASEGSTIAPDTAAPVEDASSKPPDVLKAPDCDATPDDPKCKPPKLCAACTSDADCGTGSCQKDARGERFCTRKCAYFGEQECPDTTYCKQVGNTPEDFFCYPVDGVCNNDGLDCAKCDADTDCQSGLSCFEAFGNIKYCARACGGDGTCPNDALTCTHVGDKSLCLPPPAPGDDVGKCGALPLGFCEPCRNGFGCQSGLCLESPNIGEVCSRPCDATNGCPSGTDCVQGACVPPLANGCQGFLSCFSVKCPANKTCYHGFCIDPP